MGGSFLAPTWANIYTGLSQIAVKIKSDNLEFGAIVGLARGGWVPARILSDFLGVKRLVSLQVSSYEDFRRGSLKSLDVNVGEIGEQKILLVDDVADTGSSLIYAKSLFEGRGIPCKTAAIYVKPWTRLWPDYFFQEVKEWVVFPWEIFETLETLRGQGVVDYKAALAKIGLEEELCEAIKPVLGVVYGDGDRDRLKKV